MQVPTEFLFGKRESQCGYCFSCVRSCPTKAIGIVDGHTRIIEDRCVKCGLCVSECTRDGLFVRDDSPRVRELLASEKRVVVMLATEYIVALHPLGPLEIEHALLGIGFYNVESTLLGEEIVAAEYERIHSRDLGALSLRSTCPVVVDWVCKFHPGMTKALAPVLPPYVAQAKLIKTMYKEGVAVAYVSPCYARKDEMFDPAFDGAVDVAIDFEELRRLMSESPAPVPGVAGIRPEYSRPIPVKEISLTDGFPRRTLQEHGCIGDTVMTVRGLDQLDKLLTAIAKGETAPPIVDMLNCEGCIDGPAVNPRMSVFSKRNVMTIQKERAPVPSVSTRELIKHLPAIDLRRTFSASPLKELPVTDEQVDVELSRGGFSSRVETFDCGSCGYSTCVSHATAIVRGYSSWDMCFPMAKGHYVRSIEELKKVAVVDGLTGLWNRHAFDLRLIEEAGRALRHQTPLSLLMIDVDGFKQINDSFGHTVGDEVLKALSDTFRSVVRESDYPARYGGDEFAIILPATTKTAAFAVAEKLRSAVSDIRLEGANNIPNDFKLSISIGAAALQLETGKPEDLLLAADGALMDAKKTGKDQVRLAAG